MLRLLVLVLVLANAAYWAWSQGLLASYGLAPAVQTEPQRLGTQIRPEAIRLLTPDEARKIEAGPGLVASGPAGEAPAPECLQAGLFNEEQTASLRSALETALPAGSWQFESSVEPARWIVYMGKYSTDEALAKKRGELRQLGVAFRAVTNPALAPGLALASFATQADADQELARVATKGVRTARVTQERPEARGQILKLAAVDAALRAKLDALKPQLTGKTLQSCS
ncbi:MAG: SPOR domain-containing protein [Pseudomonadota bacterium]|uniref:SPOR domain-containing protein n=1 Tax=Polaromonas sp. TaxID=1869339 RepID=UPI0017FBC758|nr:SPOR domain-containing protein [Polaromonas sp.]MBA3594925.1 SPOR domain-containing protein [Polaromonas sp.]MDQ3272160.1 SPOR domain-containing protein [Pseudomonadota bacterium]